MLAHLLTYALVLFIPLVLPLWAIVSRPPGRRGLGAMDQAFAGEAAATLEALRTEVHALRHQLCDGPAGPVACPCHVPQPTASFR